MRKICVVTNSRADYSRLKTLLRALYKRSDVQAQLFVIGSHLLSDYGSTYKEIEKDGFAIDYRLYSEINGKLPVTMAKSVGTTVLELTTAFDNYKPDLVVVHGDRYEALATATAATIMNIEVAHLQGGEVTGTIDEHIRHAVTKLSHWHFPSNESARQRVIKLGETPERVFNLGCPSVDVLLETPEFAFAELKSQLKSYTKKEDWLDALEPGYMLLMYHPVTTHYEHLDDHLRTVLEAVDGFDTKIVALWPNVDAGAEKITNMLKHFERNNNQRIAIFKNFSMDVFVNIMRHAGVMIGNSSAGVREACYLGIPVVNIGNRQVGRDRASNVVDVDHVVSDIAQAIARQLDRGAFDPEYLYGKGRSGEQIAERLATLDLGSIQKMLTH